MCSFVARMAVVPRRAREAFCRWEQTWARLTRDMVVGSFFGWMEVVDRGV